MIYVLFIGTKPADKNELSGRYYSTLQPILGTIDGFVEEMPLLNVDHPNTSCLFARFSSEESLSKWRNHPTHLNIMHDARHNVFDHYRITVGENHPDPRLTEARNQRIVIAYQRQLTPDHPREHLRFSHAADGAAMEMLTETSLYVGKKACLWVLRLKPESDVEKLEALLKRGADDTVHRIYVSRDYTKEDRTEAPNDVKDVEVHT